MTCNCYCKVIVFSYSLAASFDECRSLVHALSVFSACVFSVKFTNSERTCDQTEPFSSLNLRVRVSFELYYGNEDKETFNVSLLLHLSRLYSIIYICLII